MADDLNFDTTSAQVLALLERVVYMPTSLSLDLALALLVVVLPVVVLIGLPFLDTVLTPNERRNSARAPAISITPWRASMRKQFRGVRLPSFHIRNRDRYSLYFGLCLGTFAGIAYALDPARMVALLFEGTLPGWGDAPIFMAVFICVLAFSAAQIVALTANLFRLAGRPAYALLPIYLGVTALAATFAFLSWPVFAVAMLFWRVNVSGFFAAFRNAAGELRDARGLEPLVKYDSFDDWPKS